MGIPKFFRWMSERYPSISQLIAENRIPEFDNLYLDMNSIIHNCTHKDSDRADFRMSEEQMFIGMFNYIEHLFSKIKPKKLFFMAIDGVAPRAKMNQQRSRRFRTALDAERAREKAIKEGIPMPSEPPFDSNCITPGTDFMSRLSQQLKYFVSKKISEDRDWQGVEVVLSGHEVPGEGEHKIMEYIRLSKAQPDYNPNVRHCLYGLDADLIMLGLLSHDPHFCLLREEVTFGRASKVKSKELEHQNFFLMHLCIVREYLELEFQELKEDPSLPFKFDMERVIDDFILMAFFVGNDFLPNLPNLHINEGALALMFKMYKEVLPKAGGYLNERGVINVDRLKILLDSLQDVEFRFFEAENADAAWFKGKQMEKVDVMEKSKRKKGGDASPLTMTSNQKGLFEGIKNFVNNRPQSGPRDPHNLPSSLKASDRKFVEDLADTLHLQWRTIDGDDGERHLQLTFPPSPSDGDNEESEDEEASLALGRVLKRYNNAKVVDETAEEAKEKAAQTYEEKFQKWKSSYYEEKFGWGLENEVEMRNLTENYVQGLQWVLFYYYRGVASWPWFYQYHYSPMISDVRRGLAADMNFKLGQPFKPNEQLMGVMPDRSKSIVPMAYWPLMCDEDSPIIDFYPRDFELDMNGKKQDWEAVVKIPFIQEDRLIAAMRTREHLLSADEKARNTFGVSLKFTFSGDVNFTYPSSMPGIFPDIQNCRVVENIFDLPTAAGLESPFELMEGVLLGVSALAGFPSLYTIPNVAMLDFFSVSVFQQESRNESMVITLLDTQARTNVEYAKSQLGKRTFVGYPFLDEAKIVRVSDELFDYVLADNAPAGTPPVAIPHGPAEIENWKRKAVRIEANYAKRLGMVTGQVESLIHVDHLRGLKKTNDGASIKDYGVVQGLETDFATQTIVESVVSEDQRFLEKAAIPIEEEFPVGSRAFCLGGYGYGRPVEISAHNGGDKVDVFMIMPKFKEYHAAHDIIKNAERASPYFPGFEVARKLGLNSLVLSRLTSSFSVNLGTQRLNLGLNLKFEAKKLKVLGYSRKSERGWEYSSKAVGLIQQYMLNFPDFIAAVQANPKGDIFDANDLFPSGNGAERIKAIQDWLKTIESKSFEKVPLDAEQLDSEIIAYIQDSIDQSPEIATPPEQQAALWVRKKVGNLPRHALLKPSDAEHRLGNQSYHVGDRVIYVQETGKVPIASKGTVVGITRSSRATLLDVLFDRTFMSGTTLNDRCQPFRGSTIPSTSVLNLSDRQLEVLSQQGQARRAVPAAQSGTYGSGPFALRPAAAPPTQTFSYRAAVNGSGAGRGRGNGSHVNQPKRAQPTQTTPAPGQISPPNESSSSSVARGRGRGRGGAQPQKAQINRQGYVKIDNGAHDPSVKQNNPDFRPRPYNSVAPPPSLDASNGTRGRGRGGGGRGNGGRGRGRGRGAANEKANGTGKASATETS